MKRTNEFEVVTQSDEDEELFRRLLDTSAALWNEINYQRRTNFDDPDGDVWEIDEYRGRYGGTLGSSTVQQIERKNREAWRSFFALREKGEANGKPGFWGNQDEGRELRTYIRNTSYSVEWGEHSRLEILVGQDLKEEYGLGYQERLRLEVQGDPNWKEYDKQGRLELYYDDVSETFRAFQPVIIDNSRLAHPLADETAALDIGANNIVACTVSTGDQYLYEGRDLFKRFRETTQRIAELQSKLREGRYSSKQIDSLYRRRTRRRNHAMDAIARDVIERLYDEGVSTVYVGDLTDVLETHTGRFGRTPSCTTSGRSDGSSDGSPTLPRNSALPSKSEQKRGPRRRVQTAGQPRTQLDTKTHSPAPVVSKVTRISPRARRS